MRRHFLFFITSLIILLSGAVRADSWDKISKDGTITLGVANEVPYGYLDKDKKPAGEGPAVAMHVLKELGIKDVKVVVTEFGALIPGLRAGRFDVVAAGMYITPKRCRQALFSEPTYSIGEGFLVKKGNPDNLHGYGDIEKGDFKMGVMAGSVELGYARDFGISLSQIVTLPDYASGVAALRAGRIDALAGTSLTMAGLAEKDDSAELAQPFTDLVIDGEGVRGYGAFAFRPADTALRDQFNSVLSQYIGTEEHLAAVKPYGFGTHTLPGKVTTEELCSR